MQRENGNPNNKSNEHPARNCNAGRYDAHSAFAYEISNADVS